MSEISYQMVLSTLQTASIVIGIFYYLFNMRNAQRTQNIQHETRQLQLYLNMAQAWGKEWLDSYIDVIYNQEWDDFDDFMRKYGPISNPEAYRHCMTLGNWGQEAGILFEQQAMDPEIMWRHDGENITRIWEKLEPLVMEFRKRQNHPMFWESFENYYNELKKITEERLAES